MADWDTRFMALSKYVATWSKDGNRQVGCVITGSGNEIRAMGYNGFPRGVNDDIEERRERPAKYQWTEHAERNAIYNAARTGVSLENCRIYVPWFPCADCARAIVQSGISEVIAYKPDFNDVKWGTSFYIALQMMSEAGVEVRIMEGEAA